MKIDIIADFIKYLHNNSHAYQQLNKFLDQEKKRYYKIHISKLTKKENLTTEEATIKTRQSWVSTLGRNLEKIIILMIKDFCNKHKLKIATDRQLKSKNLNKELDMLKRVILVDFGKISVLPDADIIIYKLNNNKAPHVIAILSVKNSFRERYTETPYWKLKLSQNSITQHIKVLMITPDKDDEIAFANPPRKGRIIMEYELDGIYLAKTTFDKSNKVKSIADLLNDLKQLI